MEIEFSPNQFPVARPNRPVQGTTAAGSQSNGGAPQGVAELQRKLNELALTRTDKLNNLQPAVSDVKYPPEELLNGIAHLLAIKLTQ